MPYGRLADYPGVRSRRAGSADDFVKSPLTPACEPSGKPPDTPSVAHPCFRYTVTPAACAPQDLLVVVPWHLKNVLSGEPVVHEPYIEQARYVAEFRNWWWTNVRETGDTPSQRQVNPPDDNVSPYPAPKARIADRPEKDGGNNFGRVARLAGLMDGYTGALRSRPIAGIPAEYWIVFFRRHAESRDPEEILAHLTRDLRPSGLDGEAAADVADAISRIVARLTTR